MKTSLPTTLSFLLLLSSTKLLLAHPDGNDPVLDINNNAVSSNLQYIIKVANTDSSVLSFHNGMDDLPCPFDVVQRPLENATLATFFPSDGSTTVTESTNLVVHYQLTNFFCGNPQLSLWKVNTTNTSALEWPVVVGAFLETDPETQFSLQRVGIIGGQVAYKFVYCPSESDCHNLVLSFVGGAFRLFVIRSRIVRGSEFVLIPATSERIKLITSH